MATELKPCPFCGGEAKIRDFSTPDLEPEIGVFCTNCRGQTFVYETEAEAIEAWNRRPAKTPCDLCKFNPPSSMDGKPCTMCVADGRNEDCN